MNYPINTRLEFQLHPRYGSETQDTELHLLTKMPKDDLVWYCSLLTMMGDLLISTGNRLKTGARASTPYIQEI